MFYFGMPNILEKQEYLKKEFKICFNVDSSKTPFVGPMYWSRGENGEINWKITEVIASQLCSFLSVS